jgi:hypothetical protein
VDGYESSHGPGGSSDPGQESRPESADEQIMAKLPRSRPQRETTRRKPAQPRTAGGGPQARPRGAGADRGASPPEPAVFGSGEPAPGLPRLALDGAIEVAKLPVKVGANVTIRALDAVIKGLRRQ